MPPQLRSAHVCLTPALESELPLFLEHWNDSEVNRFLFDGREVTQTRASHLLRTFTNASPGGFWAIRLISEERFVGAAGLLAVSSAASAEPRLGGLLEPRISLSSPYAGFGLGSEVLRLLLDYAFRTEGLATVAASVDETNERSRRLVERCGFTLLSRVAESTPPLLTFTLGREQWLSRAGNEA